MNEYVIDLETAQDYVPPAKVYPLNVIINGVYIGKTIPCDEYKGFRVGEYAAYQKDPDRPYARIIAFFEARDGSPSILYEHNGWDLIEILIPYKGQS